VNKNQKNGVKIMKNRMLIISLGILMGISIVFYSCSNTNNPASATGTGIMKISMIDAPANVDSVHIWIDSVQAHISNASDNDGWTTLNNKPTFYNVLYLVNGKSAVIALGKLPAGNYSQIRLYFDPDQSTIFVNGQVPGTALTIPSGTQTGIKLNVDATIQDGTTYALTIDFDLAHSIVTTGSPTSPKYILKPVLRVVTSEAANFYGIVNPADAAAEITATSTLDNTTTKVYSTYADVSTGEFTLYLPGGDYDVVISATGYDTQDLGTQTVTAGNPMDLGTIILNLNQGVSGVVDPPDVVATITATSQSDNSIYTIDTNGSDGAFALYLPEGDYDVVISATNYKDYNTTWTVPAGVTDLGTITLSQ
jgi:hypothetical protein